MGKDHWTYTSVLSLEGVSPAVRSAVATTTTSRAHPPISPAAPSMRPGAAAREPPGLHAAGAGGHRSRRLPARHRSDPVAALVVQTAPEVEIEDLASASGRPPPSGMRPDSRTLSRMSVRWSKTWDSVSKTIVSGARADPVHRPRGIPRTRYGRTAAPVLPADSPTPSHPEISAAAPVSVGARNLLHRRWLYRSTADAQPQCHCPAHAEHHIGSESFQEVLMTVDINWYYHRKS